MFTGILGFGTVIILLIKSASEPAHMQLLYWVGFMPMCLLMAVSFGTLIDNILGL